MDIVERNARKINDILNDIVNNLYPIGVRQAKVTEMDQLVYDVAPCFRKIDDLMRYNSTPALTQRYEVVKLNWEHLMKMREIHRKP